MNPSLHLIAFNIPYPANYGGVIDVFYQITNLHRLGVKITLHCFEYGREHAPILEEYCEKVYYYKRKTGLMSAMHPSRPYIVQSRRSEELMQHLLLDDAPILFEGLHSCFYLDDERLANRIKLFRPSNIEHFYYQQLARAEKNIFKKIFFLQESKKLRRYEAVANAATTILPVSLKDESYFKENYSDNQVLFMPCFHQSERVDILSGCGDYVLFHGNLSVKENEVAASYLIDHVFPDIKVKAVIAGLQPSEQLKKKVKKLKHVSLVDSPDKEKMDDLIRNAHIHILISFQKSGLKLKLLQTLCEGRFLIANEAMLFGTGLGALCLKAEDHAEIKRLIKDYWSIPFTDDDIEQRRKIMETTFSNEQNATRLLALLQQKS